MKRIQLTITLPGCHTNRDALDIAQQIVARLKTTASLGAVYYRVRQPEEGRATPEASPPTVLDPIYLVRRPTGDGLDIDCFLDRALATRWATRVGTSVEEEYPIHRALLRKMITSQLYTRRP